MSLTFFFKDKNLKPENIRKGVKIGKVLGTLEGGGGSGNNQDITADSSTIEQTITFEEGYDGIGIFTLLPYTLQSKTVNSSTSSQTVTPDQGYDGLSSVIVNPYALESKTVNSSTSSQTVTPSQGYDGLYQVLVNPYVLDTKSLDPSTVSQTVNSSADGMSSVSVSAVTSSIDSNIQAGNIKDGVTILGVTGNMASGDWVADARKGTLTDLRSKKLDPKNYSYRNLFNYSVDAYRRLPDFTGNSTSVGGGQYWNTFSNSKYWYHNVESGWSQLGSEFPFTYINQNGMRECFMNSQFQYNSTMGSNVYIKFTNLATIENSALYSAFKNCSGAQKAEFPLLNLTGYSDYGMSSCFENFYANGYCFTLSMPNLTNVTSHAMESICKGVSMMNLPTFLPNITNIGSYGMSESFNLGSASSIMTGAVEFTNLATLGTYGLKGAFQNRTGLTSVSFPLLVLRNTDDYALQSAFYGCTGLTSASFSSLTTVNGTNGMESCFNGCTGLTSISFPALTTVNGYSGKYAGMSSCFRGCSSLTSISFPELTYIGSQGMAHCFNSCSSLTSISFPKLEEISANSFNYTFNNCTGLTSVSFPEWTTASGSSSVAYMFNGCSNLTTFSAPKLSTFTSPSTTMFGGNNSTLTTVTLHPGCLKSNSYGPIALCTGITSLTLSEDATDDVNIVWQPNLNFNSVADVLGHLDLNTSGKTCSFYSSGLTITDDAQGSLQTLYDAAVNAGWTISNLTITPYTP